MKLQQSLLVAATASLTLLAASCDNDKDNGSAGPPPSLTSPTTLKAFAVNDLNNRTTDEAEPIEINSLTIDDSNQEPGQYDDILEST